MVRDREETPLWGDSGTRTFTAQIFAPSAPAPEPHIALTLPATGIAKLASTDWRCWKDSLRGGWT